MLIVSEHVVKGIAEVIRTLLDLQLLPVDLILDVVNPLVELGDVHLSVLEAALSHLVLLLDLEDFVLELLLTLHGLLGGLLELLHVLTDNLELLFDALELVLSKLGALQRPPQLILLDSELSSELVKLLLVVGGHLGGLPEVLVVLLDGHLVVHALALKHLGLLEDAVGLLGLVGEPSDSVGQGLLGLLGLLLHEHDPPGEGGHVSLHLLVHLLLLFQGLGGLGQLVVGFIKGDLKVLYFLSIVSDITVGL